MNKKIIINLCPTGMITSKKQTPYVPESPDEIVHDLLCCSQAGASMIHIHARDLMGEPTYKKEIYAQIINGIRKFKPDLVIAVSTSGRNCNEFEKRAEVLDLEGDLKPDMASLTLSSLNFIRSASVNSPDMIMQLAEKMLEKHIKPELEVFDVGMVNYAKYLISKDLIKPPYYFNIILGNIASAQAKLKHLDTIVSELPENSLWSVGGVGVSQLNMNMLGILFGNGVRVGLEDNIWYDESKEKLATNLSLVERIARISDSVGIQVATPLEVRQMLGIENMVACAELI